MSANRSIRFISMTLALAAAIGGSGVAAAPAEGGQLDGEWTTADGSTRVRFERCGGDTCGRIVWMKQPADPETGRPWRDSKNENAELRERTVMGLTLVSALKPDGASTWSGSLYNPRDGKTYSGSVQRIDARSLKLSGCVLSIFCQSETWTKSR